MMNVNNYTAKPSVIESFKKSTGFDLVSAFTANPVKSQKARFKTREISEELNKRLLAYQGVTDKNIRLYNSKEDAPVNCKSVWLVILVNDYIVKSFYSARYTIESEPEKQKPETAIKIKAGAKAINDKPAKANKPVKLVSAEELPKAETAVTETVTLTKVEYQTLLDAINTKTAQKQGKIKKIMDSFVK